MNINKENMRKWVADLRTTDAPQETGYLRFDYELGPTGYCCLGRACEVAIENGVDLQRDGGGYAETSLSGPRYVTTDLPVVVRMWLGLDGPFENDPIIGLDQVTASKANDSLHWTFHQIADAIERYYELDKP